MGTGVPARAAEVGPVHRRRAAGADPRPESVRVECLRRSSSDIPTGISASPLFDAKPFTQPMLRFDVLPRRAPSVSPTDAESGADGSRRTHDASALNPILVARARPISTARSKDGRPGPTGRTRTSAGFRRGVAIEVGQEGAKDNSGYDPGCDDAVNSGVGADTRCPPCFHPALPDPESAEALDVQRLDSAEADDRALWRADPLPAPQPAPVRPEPERRLRRHTISTHEHNGHHGAENDGFTGAFFFPGQFYDYHYPILLGGFHAINARRPIRSRRRRMTTAGSRWSRATGTRR